MKLQLLVILALCNKIYCYIFTEEFLLIFHWFLHKGLSFAFCDETTTQEATKTEETTETTVKSEAKPVSEILVAKNEPSSTIEAVVTFTTPETTTATTTATTTTTTPKTTTKGQYRRKVYPLALYRYIHHLKNRHRRYGQRHRHLYGKHPIIFRRRLAFIRPKQTPNNVFYFQDGIHHHFHHHIVYTNPRQYFYNRHQLPYQFYKRNVNGRKQYFHHHYHISQRFARPNSGNVFFFRRGIHKHHHFYERRMALPGLKRFIILKGRFNLKNKKLSNKQTRINQAKKQN